ncbi:hypothetical protein C0Q16_27120, partial [Klebsiella pneumoniae]
MRFNAEATGEKYRDIAALAHPLGAFYNTPHGVANAILLPHVMRFNAEATG